MNDNIIHVYDLTTISGNIGLVRPAMLLLSYYIQVKDERNKARIRKTDLCSIFDVSENSVKKWITALCRAEAIKYHTDATVFVNPFLSYDGAVEDYNDVVKEWHAFRSKIPAYKPPQSAAQ